ncbi:MAG: transketolase, partial [Deltaproteobacteria bacterium]|nr:transketolase [Deltaproteobacteria bacterium]
NALEKAKAETERPSLIVLRTHIAFGSPNKQDTADAHGAPLGEEEVRLTKKILGVPEDLSFFIPEWQEIFQAYSKKYPDLTKQWVDAMSGFLTAGWDDEIPEFSVADGPIATRAASGKVLNAVAEKLPTLIGGSSDLAPSNKTYMNAFHEFQKGAYHGRNIRFGVREHAMGGIMSGMFLHNGLRPYGGTFLVFADYMRPAIRVASLMNLPIIYVFTHDSIAVGEDGPTHQPVEQLASLRAIPGLTVIRPADASETAQAWRQAVKNTRSPVALILSRQKLPVINRDTKENGLADGAYILADCQGKPDILLIATGSEVHIALEAQKRLAMENIAVRVVSMPSWELFEQTPQEYKDRVLLPDVTVRLAIEAGSPMGWKHYVGNSGAIIGMNGFGASAPGGTVMKQFGFTPENIVQKAMDLLRK